MGQAMDEERAKAAKQSPGGNIGRIMHADKHPSQSNERGHNQERHAPLMIPQIQAESQPKNGGGVA